MGTVTRRRRATHVCTFGWPRLLRVAIARVWTGHCDHLWTSLVVIPLAMTATGLLQLWWSWPILVAAAWVWSPEWRWTWVLTLQLAFFGTEWAFTGAYALAYWPGRSVLVGAVWASAMLALAVIAALNRRYQDGRRSISFWDT